MLHLNTRCDVTALRSPAVQLEVYLPFSQSSAEPLTLGPHWLGASFVCDNASEIVNVC